MSTSPPRAAAHILAGVVTDLRTHQPLLDELDASDIGGPSNPATQIYTPRSRPGPRNADIPPCYLVVDVYRSGGTGRNKQFNDASYVVEVGLTETMGWRESKIQPGSNPDLAANRIMDQVAERAMRSFGIDLLDSDGNFGGGNITAPDESGEMYSVTQWQYSLGTHLGSEPGTGV